MNVKEFFGDRFTDKIFFHLEGGQGVSPVWGEHCIAEDMPVEDLKAWFYEFLADWCEDAARDYADEDALEEAENDEDEEKIAEIIDEGLICAMLDSGAFLFTTNKDLADKWEFDFEYSFCDGIYNLK